MCEFDYEKIEGQIGYNFKNQKLLRQAFVRRSYSEENGGENNEVLEFYGDKALELIIGKVFSEKYGKIDETENNNSPFRYPVCIDPGYRPDPIGEYISDYNEGKLTEFRKSLVSRNSLARCIYDLNLESHLLLGKGDKKNNIQEKDSVKEDLFEAILGAIAIDTGWDIKKIQDSVDVMLNLSQFFSDENYVSEITDWTVDKYKCVPEFRFFDRHSLLIPMTPNTFIDNSIQNRSIPCYCNLTLGDYQGSFWAGGYTFGEAKLNVCRCAYRHLEKNDLLNTIKDEIENPNKQDAINQLETLSRRGYFELPEYQFEESHDPDGNPVWDVTCSIEGINKVFRAKAYSKKEAKKKAAYKMLKYVIENYYEQED